VEVDEQYQFEQRWYGSNPEQLQKLSEWLLEQQVEEVVMESTAQYWKPSCQKRVGAGKCREHSIWHRRCPTADGADAERFSRCGTFGEAIDFPGAGRELCAG
jgi:hypothetical protein